MMRMKKVLIIPGLCLGLAAPVWAQAPASGDSATILSSDSVNSASPMALSGETELFKYLRDGMSLAMVQCKQDKNCDLDKDEIKRVVDQLNERINLLGERYAQSREKELEPLLITYADERDKFVRLLAQYKKVEPGSAQKQGPAAYDSLYNDAGSLPSDDDNTNPPAEQSSPPP